MTGQPSLLAPPDLAPLAPPAKRRVEFHIVGTPVTQGSKRAFIPKGWTRPVVVDVNGVSLKAWRSMVAAAAQTRLEDQGLFEGPVRLTLTFHLSRPKSLAKKVTACITKPDVLKASRAVEDALSKVVYRDDSQVVELVAKKQYGDPPGVAVIVEEL